MQDFLQLATERYSVRKYSDKQIENEKLEKILKAAQIAPTGNNYQPQRIFVIKSKESLEKVRSFTPYCFNAPLVLLICYDKNVSWKTVDGHDAGLDDVERRRGGGEPHAVPAALQIGNARAGRPGKGLVAVAAQHKVDR